MDATVATDALMRANVPHDQVPDWSPDGSKIADHEGGFGDGGIWVMDADGGNKYQLSDCVAGAPSVRRGRRPGRGLFAGHL